MTAQGIKLNILSLVYSAVEARVINKPTISSLFGNSRAPDTFETFDTFSLLTYNRFTLTFLLDHCLALRIETWILFLSIDQFIKFINYLFLNFSSGYGKNDFFVKVTIEAFVNERLFFTTFSSHFHLRFRVEILFSLVWSLFDWLGLLDFEVELLLIFVSIDQLIELADEFILRLTVFLVNHRGHSLKNTTKR